MTGKEYFIHVRNVREAKESLAKHVDELRAMAEAIGGFDYAKPNIQSTPGNVTENRIIKLVDVLKKYEDVTIEWANLSLEAESRISHLSRTEYADVIRYRYLDAKRHSWGWIAEEMGYSGQRTRSIHGEALEEFERKYLSVL